jgi:DNA polymerase-3 subunit gamma/tau
MSYQVLARKWRPKSFREMAGQEHVLKALVNALDHNRLHHAYLFTGTRGVGKTTLARILAKCLNCERGVSSQPCGTCGSCVEIDEGRFIDLIEVDAASRTKVEDTRELLENVQYAPSRGRYKVYLIDEVHMLSMNSFNALLKTLEEPPPHVKFLLATTDPQKLPVTILSRCLQFNLKNLGSERITQHLKHVLQQEMIPFEEAALWQLARAADGSMRDALSLTDQAIGFGNGKITEQDLRQMLGSINQQYILDLVQALLADDARQLLAVVQQLAEHNPDYSGTLNELLHLLHRMALAQAVPEQIDTQYGDAAAVKQLAAQLSAEDLQLFYQLALQGKRDLLLAPDPRSGFEMILLRMFAFRPQAASPLPGKITPASTSAAGPQAASSNTRASPEASTLAKKPDPAKPQPSANWNQILPALNLGGVIYNTAAHCVLEQVNLATQPYQFHFTLDEQQSALFNTSHQERLSLALSQHFNSPVTVSISIGTTQMETPAALQKRLQAEQMAHARQAFGADPLIRTLVEQFDGKVKLDTIKPVQH